MKIKLRTLKNRFISSIMILVMVATMASFVTVSANDSESSIKGTILEFSKWSPNSPSSSTWITRTDVADETFGTVYRHTSKGVTETINDKGPYTAYKAHIDFVENADVIVEANDKVFVSFYYRVNTEVDGTEYAVPSGMYTAKEACYSTAMGTKLDISTTDEWKYYSAILNVDDAYDSATSTQKHLRVFTGIHVTNTSDKFCVDIAQPTAIYFGAVDGADADEMISKELDFCSTGISIADGCDDVPVKDKKIVFTFNKNFDSDNPPSKSDVTVAKSGSTDDVSYNVNFQDNKLYVTFPDGLDFGAEYTITIGDEIRDGVYGLTNGETTSVSFKTQLEGLAASMPVFTPSTLPDSGSVTAQTTVTNPLNEEKDATLLIAAYDENNTMLVLEKDVKTIPANSSESLSASVTLESYSGKYIKAFVIDETNNLIRNDFAYLSGEVAEDISISGNGAFELSLLDTQFNDNKVKIDGKITPVAQKTVLITVKDGEDKYSVITPVISNDDGTFSYEYILNSASKEGNYKISAVARNASAAEKSTFYVSNATKDSILKEINDAASVEEIEKIVSTDKMLFNLKDDYFNQNAYQAIYEQRPFDTYDNFIDMFVKSKNILSKLNSAGWETLQEVIADDSGIILYDNDEYSYYVMISENSQKKINQIIKTGKVFESFSEFRTRFSSAIKSYKESQNNNSSSGGGGGSSKGSKGSGSIYTMPFVTTAPQLPVEQPDVKQPSVEQSETGVFKDLVGVDWAKDSIEDLYSKNIVSGDGTGNFRPFDAITREEFVKLLVVAFDIEQSKEDITFTDAIKNAWYNIYLATAHNAGIVKGNADGTFGIGQSITRQDMAVMAYRVALDLGLIGQSKKSDDLFVDDIDISEYAKEAVYQMQSLGVLTGVGEGRLAPLENCTRAQAVTMIHRLMQKTTDVSIDYEIPQEELKEPEDDYAEYANAGENEEEEEEENFDETEETEEPEETEE